ncbi:hypothetical protein [Desulfatitalea tepidiphila]|uniref:hypothetical protein n=1 Tax=Desulfatitalea tepidiphila TaxID=1185843 RepID=UPI0006B5A338|nr:hypothetical protein [Desulfatitalea tepidiphila]
MTDIRNILLTCTFLLNLFMWPVWSGADELPVAGSPAPTALDAAPSPARLGQSWEGHLSHQKEAFIEVVTDPADWRLLWRRAFDAPAPELDFQQHVVACVFLGHSAPWLFSIAFGEPLVRGDRVVIPYGLSDLILELSGPFKAGGQYRMKVFERKSGYAYGLEETLYNDM